MARANQLWSAEAVDKTVHRRWWNIQLDWCLHKRWRLRFINSMKKLKSINGKFLFRLSQVQGDFYLNVLFSFIVCLLAYSKNTFYMVNGVVLSFFHPKWIYFLISRFWIFSWGHGGITIYDLWNCEMNLLMTISLQCFRFPLPFKIKAKTIDTCQHVTCLHVWVGEKSKERKRQIKMSFDLSFQAS